MHNERHQNVGSVLLLVNLTIYINDVSKPNYTGWSKYDLMKSSTLSHSGQSSAAGKNESMERTEMVTLKLFAVNMIKYGLEGMPCQPCESTTLIDL